MNIQQTSMRTFGSLLSQSQIIRRLLLLEIKSKRSYLHCIASTEKYYHKWLQNILMFERCNSVKFTKFHEFDASLEGQKNFSTTVTTMAKGRVQKEKKKNAPKRIDEDEMALLISVEDFKKHLDRAIEDLKNDYMKFVSLRTSAGAIEQLPIHYKERNYVLQEIAQISRKPNMVVINVDAFPDAATAISASLNKSQMNLSPQQDGTTFYLKIPKLTKEYRESLAKNAKTYMVKCKENIRSIRSKYIKQINNLEKQPIDLVRRVTESLDGIIDQYNKEAEHIYSVKQQELLGE